MGSLTHFHRAVAHGNLQAVKDILKDHPQLIAAVDENGWTALHWAASNGDIRLTGYLLERGADVNARGLSGETPLILADEPVLVELLLAAGADPTAADEDGLTAMTWAATLEDWDLASALATPDQVDHPKRIARG